MFAVATTAAVCACAQPRTELRFAVQADPKTFDPLLASEEASETIAYLTSGVLIRLNRATQRLEPELATGWKVQDAGKRIDFTLRRGVCFSDGTPFDSQDVATSIRRMMDPNLHSAVADTFRPGGIAITARTNGPERVSVLFDEPVAGVEFLFDQLPIVSSRSRQRDRPVLGPFFLADYRSGQYALLQRNSHYWKTDSAGRPLPYLNSVRISIQSNRDIELLRFKRGELDFVDKMQPDAFERLHKEPRLMAQNAGPSLDSEFLWFNQSPKSAIPSYKRRWFESSRFRRAVSAAINRNDIIRLVYLGHAHEAFGPVSTANKLWFNSRLPTPEYDLQKAVKLLEEDGFHLDGRQLRDGNGNRVEFSLITNAGSKTRTQIGEMIQQDLSKIGMRLNFTPIEFQSLIERITSTQDYESCLLGLVNMDIDPNSQSNVWLSSGTHHAWSPGESRPATAWEGEIDHLIREQSTAGTLAERKMAFDRVQAIASEQAPIIYLVNPDVLVGVSRALRGIIPSPITPHLFWNVEYLSISPGSERTSN
jgi:peptide/nickel transport system substrate-binding protein